MAWFKKERKPRTSQRERRRDSRRTPGRSVRSAVTSTSGKSSSGPSTSVRSAATTGGYSAEEYIDLLTDEGYLARAVRRPPLAPTRCSSSITPTGWRRRSEEGRAGRRRSTPAPAGSRALPYHLGVMNFAFMGGSMGSVVGEKIARLARRSLEASDAAGAGLHLRRRPDAGGGALADADGQDLVPRWRSWRGTAIPYHDHPDRSRRPAASPPPSRCRAT